ncbi:MAG: hypothetical protein KDA84_19950 [Planctomycetaceae bacterium]|nr:hypothetical protein [Planctomycetaceae bacterium]
MSGRDPNPPVPPHGSSRPAPRSAPTQTTLAQPPWASRSAGETISWIAWDPDASFAHRTPTRVPTARGTGQPVGIVKHSVGGTNLAVQWNPKQGKNLYAALKAKVDAAGKMRSIKVAGAFWMQGGADAKSETRAAAYVDNLDLLIAAMRRDFDNPSLPVVAGRSGRGPKSSNPRYPAMGKVRAGQEKARPNYAWVDCDQITVGPDKIHYDTRGIVELGRKMATAMHELLNAEGK